VPVVGLNKAASTWTCIRCWHGLLAAMYVVKAALTLLGVWGAAGCLDKGSPAGLRQPRLRGEDAQGASQCSATQSASTMHQHSLMHGLGRWLCA
jgi:hypothetical protein